MVNCKWSLQLKIAIASPIVKDLFSHSGLTKREEKKVVHSTIITKFFWSPNLYMPNDLRK